jgi:hypothetical protein
MRASLPRVAANFAGIVLLLTMGAILEARHLSSLSSLSGADTWWHLRTGNWILANHAVPRQALFSQSTGLSWADPSWAFDGALAVAYHALGLRAVPALLMGFRVALAALTFFLAAGWRGAFWPAIVVSACAQYILAGLPPGPTYCSVLLFGVELALLLEVRRTGDRRFLFALPVLFLAWANLDVQFVIGVALLVIFLFAAVLEKFVPGVGLEPRTSSLIPPTVAWATLAFAATFVTPYLLTPYRVFLERLTSSANSVLPDSRAMNFKQPTDYLLLLLTMAAFLALGRRRSRDIFQISALLLATVFSFHAQRDVWMVTLIATAVLGEALRVPQTTDRPAPAPIQPEAASPFVFRRRTLALVTASVAAILIAAVLRLPRDRGTLLARAGRTYPVAASDAIREQHLPGPIFNSYEWGGFLMWYLPEYPVAIDGRPSLYSDDDVLRYSKVMNADLPYTSDPALTAARTLVLPRHSLMGEALKDVSGFQTAYGDETAIVLVKAEL